MNISSIGMQSVPSYNGVKSNHTVAQQPEVAEIQQPTSDIFLSSLVNLTDKGLVECQDLPVSSSEKQTMKLSDEAVGELLGQIVAQCEEEKAPLSASNNTGAILMGEDEFQAASLGSLGIKSFEDKRIPTLESVKDYDYIKPSDAVINYVTTVRPDLNIVERGCIKAYCSVAYLQMNGYLLGTKKSHFGVVRKATECMSDALNRHDVPQGSILYRTASLAELRNYMSSEDYEKFAEMQTDCTTEELTPYLEAKISGTQSKRKTFLSTTINPNFDFQDKPKVATKLYVGENVKGIYVATDKLSPFPEEEEYILAPETKMTVMGVEYNEKNKGFVLNVFAGDLPKSEA